MVNDMSYQTISRVLASWDLARQRFGCEEKVGIEILFRLFRMEPETKVVFGFKPTQDIENHPMLRMGVLVHGAHIVKMLDGVLALLGPDAEMLEEILGQLGQRHQRHGVKTEYFSLLGDAIRETLASIIGISSPMKMMRLGK
jgi:hypothetical protein